MGDPRTRDAADVRGASTVERALCVALILALFAPLGTSLGLEITHRDARAHPISDLAIIDLAAREASHLERKRGPYSRHGWSHPGPLYYYVLAAGLWVAGEQPLTLPLVVFTLAALSLAMAAWVTFSRDEDTRSKLVLGLALALIVASLQDKFYPCAFTGRWNPIAPLLPYLAMWTLLSGVARARWLWLIPVGVIHALVSQTHIGFLLPATVGVGVAVGLGLRRERPRAIIAALAAAAFCLAWLPAFAAPENISDLVAFFRDGGGERPVGFSPLGLAATQTQAALLQLVPDSWGAAALPLLFAELGLLGWLTSKTLRGPDEERDVGVLVATAHLAVAVFACFFVDHVGAEHSTFFAVIAGALGWGELARWAVARLPAGGRIPVAHMATAAAVLTAGFASARLPDAYDAWANHRRTDIRIVEDLLEAAQAEMRSSTGAPPVVTVAPWRRQGDHEYWPWVAALRLALLDAGSAPSVDPAFEFMFWGPGPYRRAGPDTLVLGPPGRGDHPVLGGGGPVRLYGPAPEGPVEAPALAPLALRTGLADGVDGQPDGAIQEGQQSSPWRFHHAGGQIRLHGPRARWVDVRVDADEGDVFELEIGCDGEEGRGRAIAETPGELVEFDPPYSTACDATLTLTDAGPDGLGVLRALTVRGVSPAFSVIGLPDGVNPEAALLRPAPDGATRADVPWAVCLEDETQAIVLRAPALPLGRLAVSASTDAELLIESFVDGGWQTVSSLQAQTRTSEGDAAFSTRVAYLEPGTPPRILRLRPREDGEGCVAHVHPIAGPGHVVPMNGGPDVFARAWSSLEQHDGRAWRWTLGREATLNIPQLPPAEYTLLARIGTHTNDRPQGVTFGVGGRMTDEADLRPGMHLYRIPLRIEEGDTELLLRTRWAARPPEGDPRELGVTVEYIALVPPRRAPEVP